MSDRTAGDEERPHMQTGPEVGSSTDDRLPGEPEGDDALTDDDARTDDEARTGSDASVRDRELDGIDITSSDGPMLEDGDDVDTGAAVQEGPDR
jgi:hypothetical protein